MAKIKTNLNDKKKNIQKYFCQSKNYKTIFRQLGNKYEIGIYILKPFLSIDD